MSPSEEFPCLSTRGLYAHSIPGDGNCMFSALSDQVYGTIDHSSEIRANVIEHVKGNKAHYINFIDVAPGGGTNRRPKRKNAAYNKREHTPNTQAQIDRAFDNYVSNMAQKGTYGDNMEIVAFSAYYGISVRIYQAHDSYVIPAPKDGAPVAHIAYHADYEHYSSVRKIDGPHEGPPEIPAEAGSFSGSQTSMSSPPPWLVKVVMSSCPFYVDEQTALQALMSNHNSLDAATAYLIETNSSANSTPDVQSVQSSSVERELGSDEESKERKRQDRRLSRARQERQVKLLREKVAASISDDSLDSLLNSSASSLRYSYGDSADEAMSSPPPLDDGSTSPESSYSPPSEVTAAASVSVPQQPKPRITFKFSKPVEPAAPPAQAYPTKLILKHKSPKKGLSARDAKALKKQAQKQARKERAQAELNVDAMNVDSSVASSSQGSTGSQPVVTQGFRTMHI